MKDFHYLKNEENKQEDNDGDSDMKSTSSWSPIIKSRKRFLKEEAEILEKKYAIDVNPSVNEIQELADKIGTTKKIITTWFQNRRAKEKRKEKKKENKYNKKIEQELNNYKANNNNNNNNNNNEPKYDSSDLIITSFNNTLTHYTTSLYLPSYATSYQCYANDNSSSNNNNSTFIPIEDTNTASSIHHPHSQFIFIPPTSTFNYWAFNSILTTEPFYLNDDFSSSNSPLNIHHELFSLPEEENTIRLNDFNYHSLTFPIICCVDGCLF
ncbi:unnamed protein product [Cunninghamella echinulata]